MSHHYDSSKAAILRAIKEPSVAHGRLRSICDERGEKFSHKMDCLQLSRKDQVSISRLRCGHHLDLKYWLHKIGRALNTVCRKFCMGEETVEHAMVDETVEHAMEEETVEHAMGEETVEQAIGECPQIQRHMTLLPEPYVITTNPFKSLEFWKL